MKKKTLKALVAVLSVVLIVCMSVAGTLAYLKVTTTPVTNTFAPSNIDLTLTETTEEYKMVPGVDISKDPKVTVTADIDSYVFVKVEESNITVGGVTYVTYTVAADWEPLVDTNNDGIADNGVYYRKVSADLAKDGAAFYVLAGNETYPNGVVQVPNTITKTDMDKLYSNGAVNTNAQPKLIFTAYAIQQAGFADVAAAWTAAQSQQG